MQTQIVKMINDFEHGRLSRRQLIAHLTGMFAASLGATLAFANQQPGRTAPNPADSTTTFEATDLNHIALSVSDVQRSQKWYQKHLGLKPRGQEGFLTTGRGWLRARQIFLSIFVQSVQVNIFQGQRASGNLSKTAFDRRSGSRTAAGDSERSSGLLRDVPKRFRFLNAE